MKVLDEIISVERAAWEHTDGALRVAATLKARRDSTVYAGHFPSKPVTPGVCMIGAVVELLAQATAQPLRLAKVNNTKYLAMMTPDDIDGATLAATISGDTATASYTKGDTVYAKMKLTLNTEH